MLYDDDIANPTPRTPPHPSAIPPPPPPLSDKSELNLNRSLTVTHADCQGAEVKVGSFLDMVNDFPNLRICYVKYTEI